MPPASIVPIVAFPLGIPFTLQLTAVFPVLLTIAVKVRGSPSKRDAAPGTIVTLIFEGGSCDGPDPTSPPQPRNDATKSNAGLQCNGVRVRKQRPRSFVPPFIAAGIARGVPAWCIEKESSQWG
jgi:hypothetical protein